MKLQRSLFIVVCLIKRSKFHLKIYQVCFVAIRHFTLKSLKHAYLIKILFLNLLFWKSNMHITF